MIESAPVRPGHVTLTCLIAGPILAIALYLLLQSVAPELSHAARAAAAVAVLMGVWWVTEALPLEVTGLTPIVLFPILGVATLKEAAAPFADPIIYLFLGGMLLGQAMELWGLHRRLALNSLAFFGGRPAFIVLGFLLVTAFISMWVSNTAATVMMLPIGASVAAIVTPRLAATNPRHAPETNFMPAIVLAIAFGATIGGVGTIIGTPPITQYAGYMRSALGKEVSFVAWLPLGLSALAIFLPITWLVLTRLAFRVPTSAVEGVADQISSQRRALGPLSRGEWIVLIIFTLAATCWIGVPLLAAIPAVKDSIIGAALARTGDATIAIAAALALFIIPVSLRERRMALSWAEAKQVPWGILLLFGGGLSLAESLRSTGVDKYIASLASPLGGTHPFIVLLILSAAAIILTEFLNNTALVAAALPVASGIAESLGLPAAAALATVTLSASLGFMLPGGTAPNALVFSSGRVNMPQMMRAGAWLDVACAIGSPSLVMLAWKLGLLPGL